MANIAEYLNKIQTAVYGEEVRGSIYNAIDLINKVGEVTLTLGTAITSTSSPTSGYYDKSVYINTNTWDIWRCTGSSWTNLGNLLGSSIASVKNTGKKADTNDLVDIYHIYTDNNADIGSFEVINGADIRAYKSGNSASFNLYYPDGKVGMVTINDGAKITVGTAVTSTNSSVYNQFNKDLYINSSTWDLWQCTASTGSGYGNAWTKIGNIKGAQGIQGIRGFDFTGLVLKSTSGLVKTYDVMSSDGTTTGTIDISDGVQGVKGDRGYGFAGLELYSESGLDKVYNVKASDGAITGTVTITNGAKGDKGDKGNQGDSIASVDLKTKINRDATYNVVLDNGSVAGSFTVSDGATGAQGPQGVSPTVSGSKDGKVTIITITDVNGDHVYEIRDGNDGDGTGDMIKATYDTNDDGVVDAAERVTIIDSTPTEGSTNPVTSGGVYELIGNADYVSRAGDTMTGALTIGERKSGSTVGTRSLAIGVGVEASGTYAIAEGNGSTASGNYAVAAGTTSSATGNNSLAAGQNGLAQGVASAAIGNGVRATVDGQVVVGKFNDVLNDAYHTDAIFEVGIGTSTSSGNRKNGLSVLNNGDLRVAGDIYANNAKVSGAVVMVATFSKTLTNYNTSSVLCKENITIEEYNSDLQYYIQVLEKTDSAIYGVEIMPATVTYINARTVQIQYYEVKTSVAPSSGVNGTYKLGIFAVPKI